LSAHITRAGEGEQFQLGVEIEVPPGITILFGPSGSGKSTCLQIIAGLLRPDRGRVALGDEPWLDTETGIDLPVHRRHVAYVFQSLALFPHMTAERNVMYGIPRHIDKHERRERARAMLDKLAVGHLAGRKPRTFSGGEAQRVALARALATSPRVLLLDEPFSALDRDLRVQLARLVRELVDELGLPTVQVTHNHGEARAMGDRVLRMERGGVIAQGSVPDVLGADERGGHEVGTNEQARSRFDDIGRTPMPVLRPGEPER
jgi:molybdate transport system ATP-binding protein